MPQVYSVPDGYFGDRVKCRLSLYKGNIIEVTDKGCYSAPVRRAASEAEVLWLVDNHPTMRKRYVKLEGGPL